MNESLCFAWMA